MRPSARAQGQPVADRGRQPEQRRARPCDPARQSAPARRPTTSERAAQHRRIASRRSRPSATSQIEVSGGFGRPPKPLTPEAEALFELVKPAGADLGQSIAWQPTGGVCDGNNIAACGVPVVDTMGVRGGKIHSKEEYLIVDSLAERAALSALTILRLAWRPHELPRSAARPETISRAFYKMAKLTGGGFTNLPADRATLVAKLERAPKSFARKEDTPGDDLYVFVLEDPKTGRSAAPARCSAQVGVDAALLQLSFSTLTQTSPELGKTFRNQTLTLTNDLEGSSEVGGLFLHPEVRAGGWGGLLARSRYLFMKLHRERFGDRDAGRASRGDGRRPAMRLSGTRSPAGSSA